MREPNFVNYADTLQADMQEVMGINNELREIVMAAREHVLSRSCRTDRQGYKGKFYMTDYRSP